VPILVDGNNVMGQTPGWHRDKPGSRQRLLGELAAYVAASKARVTVVFDGAPETSVPDGSTFRGVKVYYPARGSDADSVIERLVRMSADARGVTVVTSDRQLAAECRSLGARVVRSGDFRKQMAEVGARAAEPGDPGADDAPASGDLGEWLDFFGMDPPSD
jgi:predicted RNA-binding protein with PIN domain